MSTQIKGANKQIQNDNLEQFVKSTNEKTTRELEKGKNATTMKPTVLYPIMFKEVLAGEYIENWMIDNMTRLLTPLVPTFDRTYINIKAFFVPHTRVWEGAEKALARQSQDNETLNAELPTITLNEDNTKYSTFSRMLTSRYGIPNNAGNTKINVLLLRGYRAIVNDYIRNKDYSSPKIEWKDNTVTNAERYNIIGYKSNSLELRDETTQASIYKLENAPTRKGYLTNIKKKIAGEYGEEEITNLQSTELYNHLDWQTRFQLAKQSQDNINKNDWDIIAEMGGTQPVKTDRVEYLGEVDYEMNFQQITQSAPEIDNSSPLGTTGSFSFTKASGTLFSHKKFLQHGFIHILANVNIDNYFENATPKEIMKTTVNDIYTPALAKKETQLLLKGEIRNQDGENPNESIAYQPAWAEYKRLPSFASGQMQTEMLQLVTDDNQYLRVSNAQWHNMKRWSAVSISDENYFRDIVDVQTVFGRNNILYPTTFWKIEPLMNMSEHTVTTSLPIEKSVLTGNSKAEQTR